MHLKPISVIDQVANQVARSAELLDFALEGVFERILRDNLSLAGLNEFYRVSGQLMQNTVDQIERQMQEGDMLLKRTQHDAVTRQSEALNDLTSTYRNVTETLWGAFQQLRVSYMKRLRAMLAAKTSGTSQPLFSPRVRSRAGRTYRPYLFVYLEVRQALVDQYNTAQIAWIADQGYTHFKLDTTDEALLDKVFAVADYQSVADEYFHPRTLNLVGAPYVST